MEPFRQTGARVPVSHLSPRHAPPDHPRRMEGRHRNDTASGTRTVVLLVFSKEPDRVLAGLLIATAAAALGLEVTVFFTFWGINVLREKPGYAAAAVGERMIDLLTPSGTGFAGVSQRNLLGTGRQMLRKVMQEQDIVAADRLLDLAKENGVRLLACSTTMQLMGIRREELVDGIEIAGAARYLVDAGRSGCTLFI